MVAPQNPTVVVEHYFAAFNAGNAAAIGALFADDASVQDPIGTPSHIGREAITQFYQAAINTGARLTPTGAIRVAGKHVAFPFCVQLEVGGSEMIIEVIDTMRFDDEGQIEEMRAYFNTTGVRDFLV